MATSTATKLLRSLKVRKDILSLTGLKRKAELQFDAAVGGCSPAKSPGNLC